MKSFSSIVIGCLVLLLGAQRGQQVILTQTVASGGSPTVSSPGCLIANTTTSAFSTTGKTFMAVGVTYYPPDGTNTTTDSLGNTFTDLTVYGGGPAVKFSYTALGSTSGSTTVSLTHAGIACIFLTTGITGTSDSGSDQGTNNISDACQPDTSSINPGANHVALFVWGGSVPQNTTSPTMANTGAGGDTYAVASPFVYFNPGNNFGAMGASVVLTGATNPTGTWVGSGASQCAEASFH